MNAQPLMATDRPRQLVSRTVEMVRIRQAMTDAGSNCRVVTIEGEGGLGKTRILEEVLRRLGQPDVLDTYGNPLPEHDWTELKSEIIYCNLIDFTNIKLHTREYFLEQLGNSGMWHSRIKFGRFKTANDRWRRLSDYGAAYTLLKPATEAAEAAFWADFEEASQKYRLVILLDTTEQLAIISSQWLLKRNLLTEEDLLFNTQQWLLKKIVEGKFKNTTFIIAGRGKKGKPFFDALNTAIAQADPSCEKIPIPLKPFTLVETEEFFRSLYQDWTSPPHNNSELAADVQPVLEDLLDNPDRLRVLWHYTGGQPVRLSLYTDILIEGQQIPEPLLETYDQAQSRTSKEEANLQEARRKIERVFIDLLFRSGGSLHSQILQMLVRTPHGLTSKQLDFVLNAKPEDCASTWEIDPVRVGEIEKELESIRTLSIVKDKPGERIGLQDEVYDIYADRMSDEEATRLDEMEARRAVYSRLSEWASARIARLEKQRESFIREDLSRIRVERPSNILNTRLPQPSSVEQKRRNEIVTTTLDHRLEYLHYQLLIDPEKNFNDTYYDLADVRASTYDESESAVLQAEMWRVITDSSVLRFVEMKPRDVMQRWHETPAQVLLRAAQTDDAIKWIIRLHVRREYKRAVELADNIDTAVLQLTNEREKHSWNHTLTRADRDCWREFSRTYSGQDVNDSITTLNSIIKRLIPLSKADIHQLVYPQSDEYGFIGHPALPRLQFLIASIYNNLGYSYVSAGNYRAAGENYTAALKYMRESPSSGFGQEAATRNNLSRALIEMGKKRALRVCQDALELRIRQGFLTPIAYSYNTMALIWNDLRQPQNALTASARALAIAQYIQEPRVVGLALLQVGEALRRLATSNDPLMTGESTEDIYREAADVLQQAYELFSDPESSVSKERIRTVEAAIELGSLYRDWVAFIPSEGVPPEIRQQRQDNAVYYLQEAIDLAHELNLTHLELDALVNIGWTYYHVGQWEETESILQKAEDSLVPDGARLHEGEFPPNPYEHPNFLFKQLSKMYSLRGQIAGKRFRQGVVAITEADSDSSTKKRQALVHEDKELQGLLRRAAFAFTQAVAYAQLFAPGSVQLTMAYDELYEFLKKLNQQELSDFYCYEQVACSSFKIREMKLENFGDVEEFLRDCFGDYYEATNTAVPKETL
jgi:tetratricopeptide (TPR) repeat protein